LIPVGEYLFEKITFQIGKTFLFVDLLENSKYVLQVNDNKSTLQLFVVEPVQGLSSQNIYE